MELILDVKDIFKITITIQFGVKLCNELELEH